MSNGYINSKTVRARYNNITSMTLWRWERDPEMGFPQPMIINRRKLYPLDEILEWERRRAATSHRNVASAED